MINLEKIKYDIQNIAETLLPVFKTKTVEFSPRFSYIVK